MISKKCFFLFEYIISLFNSNILILVLWKHKYILPSDVLCLFQCLATLNKCTIAFRWQGWKKEEKQKLFQTAEKQWICLGQCSSTSSPSSAPSWHRTGTLCSGTARKWVKKKCSLCLPNNSQGCTLLVFALCSLIVSLISSYPVHCVLLSFHVGTAYMYFADKYKTAHTEDGESLAFKCFRLSAIMIM